MNEPEINVQKIDIEKSANNEREVNLEKNPDVLRRILIPALGLWTILNILIMFGVSGIGAYLFIATVTTDMSHGFALFGIIFGFLIIVLGLLFSVILYNNLGFVHLYLQGIAF